MQLQLSITITDPVEALRAIAMLGLPEGTEVTLTKPAPAPDAPQTGAAQFAHAVESPAPAALPAQAAPAEVATVGLADVRAVINDLAAKKGLPAVANTLQQFKAARLSELPADQYGAFVAACRQALA